MQGPSSVREKEEEGMVLSLGAGIRGAGIGHAKLAICVGIESARVGTTVRLVEGEVVREVDEVDERLREADTEREAWEIKNMLDRTTAPTPTKDEVDLRDGGRINIRVWIYNM